LIPDILNQTKHTYSQLIREKAIELGFTACGFAPVRSMEEHRKHLQSWLDSGYHGTMDYMANHFEKRLDPAKLVEGAKSVISVLLNYYPASKQRESGSPVISKYAYGKDYHYVIKKKLNNLLKYIQQNIGEINGRGFVDSAPVMERSWAKLSGLGWIGKNSNLITKHFGSYVFIGELIVDIELNYDTEIKNYCGACSLCIDACPTGAIVKPYVINANKCISYLTIELKDEILKEIKGKLNNWIFGCDICKDVCPWNQNLVPHTEPELNPNPNLLNMTQKDWYEITEEFFEKIFKNSAIKRTKFKKFKENIVCQTK
jgi:epoxyqueuosine reductase